MSNSGNEHNQRILDQFTRQAVPFAQAPSHSTEESLRIFIDTVGVTPEDKVLDVACGPGIISCALASIAREVTGFDLVPAMLDEARKRQASMGLKNLEWRLGDAGHLPFEHATFDLVVTRYSFHHLLDPGAVLAEMTRVCRPGGRVAVADVTPEEEKTLAYDELEITRDPSHTHALSFGQLKALGTQQGLQLANTDVYRLDNSVESLLSASFPPAGNADRFRRMVRDDIGIDRFSIGAYLNDGELRFSFPTSIVVWRKPTALRA
jgi:2-polyprenyl-3-methyl-5-hydroxy-6-metoxy-1,4-benzoquinol methylase